MKAKRIIQILAVVVYSAGVLRAGTYIPNDFTTESRDKEDRIFWTTQPVLGFDDFKADTRKDPMFSENYSEDIRVLAKIRKTILVQKKTVGNMAKFKVYAAMIRSGSWIKTPGDSASLRHEQAHYDICEIYARMLRRDLVKAKTMDEAKRMFNWVSSQEMVEQNLFDTENSGHEAGMSPEWAEKIARRLKELEVYKNPVVVISIRG